VAIIIIYRMFNFDCKIVGADQCVCTDNTNLRICRDKNKNSYGCKYIHSNKGEHTGSPLQNNTPRLSLASTHIWEGN